jgi:hypothetical protein
MRKKKLGPRFRGDDDIDDAFAVDQRTTGYDERRLAAAWFNRYPPALFALFQDQP